MSLLAEGFWPCTILGAEVGEIDGIIKARVNVKIEDGPSKGRMCTYEDEVNAKSSLYIGRSLTAVGWKGKSLTTVKDDCAAWITATGGKSTVEIKHIQIKNGRRAGEIWDKPNSIGRGPKPFAAPKGEALADADAAMRKALADDGFAGGSTPDETAPTSNDDIPFITSARVPMGEVLR